MDRFLSYFNLYKENIKFYRDFLGKYYTLFCKENILKTILYGIRKEKR